MIGEGKVELQQNVLKRGRVWLRKGQVCHLVKRHRDGSCSIRVPAASAGGNGRCARVPANLLVADAEEGEA